MIALSSLQPAPKVEAASRIVRQLAASFDRAHHVVRPFDYWLLSDILPEKTIKDIVALPFVAPSKPTFDGRRETNNFSRIFFSPENQARYPVCEAVAQAFGDALIVEALGRIVGRELGAGKLRIEYCQDVDGFWLEPHLDIAVKMLTMLVYLSDDPNLSDAGTDIYDDSPEHKLVASAPYAKNKGLIFTPGANTWHGLSKRPIRALRRSLIINFVSSDWRQTTELAFP
jgi:hypothetical protein